MVVLVLSVYFAIFVFYWKKVKKDKKTYHICIVLLLFCAIVQTMTVLGYDFPFSIENVTQAIERSVN